MRSQNPPHPALEAALRLLREAHQDPAQRAVLNEVARLYHEGYPETPKGIVPLKAVYEAMSARGVRAPSAASFVASEGSSTPSGCGGSPREPTSTTPTSPGRWRPPPSPGSPRSSSSASPNPPP